MEALKLLEESEQPKQQKQVNWKIARCNLLYQVFEEVKGTKLKTPYGMVMGLLTKISECVPSEQNKYHGWAWTDENGEIQFEIPPIEDFEAQFRGFLDNEYAKKANYSLPLFFMQYGNYEVVKEKIPLKVKPVVKETAILIRCTKCNKNFKANEYHNCEESK